MGQLLPAAAVRLLAADLDWPVVLLGQPGELPIHHPMASMRMALITPVVRNPVMGWRPTGWGKRIQSIKNGWTFQGLIETDGVRLPRNFCKELLPMSCLTSGFLDFVM